MEAYQYIQYQVNGTPIQICQRIDYDPNAEVVGQQDPQHVRIVEQPVDQHFVEECIVETNVAEFDENRDLQRVLERETPNRKGLNKDLICSNKFNRFVRTGPLHPDLMQAIVNRYATLRTDNPFVGHGKALAETSRSLGVSIKMVMTSLKDLNVPFSTAVAKKSDSDEEVLLEEVTSSKDCLRLVDERIIMGLAKSFKSRIAVKDRSMNKFRVYKPPNARKKLTLSFNGCSYKKVANSDSVLLAERLSRNLTCQTCEKKFQREQALISHVRIHKSRRCDICDLEIKPEEGSSASVMLAKHEVEFHREETLRKRKKPVKCKKCFKIFTSRGSLVRHRSICSPSCDRCGKTFKSRGVLKNHPCPFNIKVPELARGEKAPDIIQLLGEGREPLLLKKADVKIKQLSASRFYSEKIAALKATGSP